MPRSQKEGVGIRKPRPIGLGGHISGKRLASAEEGLFSEHQAVQRRSISENG